MLSYKGGGQGEQSLSLSLALWQEAGQSRSLLVSLWTVWLGAFVFRVLAAVRGTAVSAWAVARVTGELRASCGRSPRAASERGRPLQWDCHVAVVLCVRCFLSSSITVVVTVCSVFLCCSVILFLSQNTSFAFIFWSSFPSHQGQGRGKLGLNYKNYKIMICLPEVWQLVLEFKAELQQKLACVFGGLLWGGKFSQDLEKQCCVHAVPALLQNDQPSLGESKHVSKVSFSRERAPVQP